MIRLDEVAQKIENILNGTDEDVIALNIPTPTGFLFRVSTEGFHLDGIADEGEGKNFIPVFISSMGGNFNPVPELLQANYVIPIALYFPVSFKNEMYMINEYLAKVFVGRYFSYGSGGKALSNVSVAQFGEIVDVDLKQFKQWAEVEYKRKIEIMEPYIQMSMSLYLSSASEDYVYGNEAIAKLSYVDGLTYTDNNISFATGSLQSNSEQAVQQLLGTSESEGLPVGTAYGSSFSVYVKRTEFYTHLLDKWFKGQSQTIKFTLQITFMGLTFTKECYMQSANWTIEKGELTTITFSFGKKASVAESY